MANEQYKDCDSRLVQTKFGDTQVFACGSPENPPVVLFHGISANSLMFGDWLVPKLSQTHYTVAVDTLGDMGRSLPTNGDPSNCPQTEEQVAEWASEVFTQLNIKKASLVGFSLGSFLASSVAMNEPALVDKLVLIAPAGVFASIELGWLLRAITFAILSNILSWNNTAIEYLQNWFFGYMTTAYPATGTAFSNAELRKATDKIGGAQVGVRPIMYSVEALRGMNSRHPTLLIIGEKETVVNSNVAIETATQAGINVKAYPDGGHVLFAESPRDDVVDVVASFLDSSD